MRATALADSATSAGASGWRGAGGCSPAQRSFSHSEGKATLTLATEGRATHDGGFQLLEKLTAILPNCRSIESLTLEA